MIQEATPAIVNALQPLTAYYPYTFFAPETSAYGMALFSKMPILNAQRTAFENRTNHYTLLQLNTLTGQTPFTLIELHALSPSRDQQRQQRKEELIEIANLIVHLPYQPIIVVGEW